MTELFDRSARVMRPRLLVRQRYDNAHVYCLVRRGMRDEVIKIHFSEDPKSDALRVHPIYESSSSKLEVLEPDPYSMNILMVVDDD